MSAFERCFCHLGVDKWAGIASYRIMIQGGLEDTIHSTIEQIDYRDSQYDHKNPKDNEG